MFIAGVIFGLLLMRQILIFDIQQDQSSGAVVMCSLCVQRFNSWLWHLPCFDSLILVLLFAFLLLKEAVNKSSMPALCFTDNDVFYPCLSAS